MTPAFNRADCERVYRESLKPIFAGHPQEPRLDYRNLFYLVDLGAGLSVFGPMARALGMEVTLIDDFGGGGGVFYGQQREDSKVLAGLPQPLVNGAAIVSEKLLRFFPSLCSDIHVVGRKDA